MNVLFSATSRQQRPVWLVLFDRLPGVTSDSGALEPSAFDQLEASGIVFEQYIVQDLRSAATLDDYLGGAEAIGNWCRDACLPERSVVWLKVISEEQPAVGVFSASELVASTQASILALSRGELLQPSSEAVAVIQSAALVIVSVSLPPAAATAIEAADLLSQLQSLSAGLSASRGCVEPIWLVTGFRGFPRPLEPPLECGADESQMHVPLWVTAKESAGTRLQLLCGSFDLLPTLSELLTHRSPAPCRTASTDAPLNLLAGEFQRFDSTPRLLKLHHDNWYGLRTSLYFLVQPTNAAAEPNLPGESSQHFEPDEPPEPRLYLKPDDYWNINNSIVAFREIAEQMAAANDRQAT